MITDLLSFFVVTVLVNGNHFLITLWNVSESVNRKYDLKAEIAVVVP